MSGMATEISGAPTDEEAVAIMAAVEALWPKPVIAADPTPERQPVWRFSGRWWTANPNSRTIW